MELMRKASNWIVKLSFAISRRGEGPCIVHKNQINEK